MLKLFMHHGGPSIAIIVSQNWGTDPLTWTAAVDYGRLEQPHVLPRSYETRGAAIDAAIDFILSQPPDAALMRQLDRLG